MRGSLVRLFVLCMLIMSSVALTGYWRDACEDNKCYGGLMSLCRTKDNEVYGRYSDIGFIVGDYKDGKVSGQWFEAGYTQYNHGGFEWIVDKVNSDDDDGIDKFAGSWWFADRKCDRFGWASSRVNDDDEGPSLEECGILYGEEGRSDLIQDLWISSDGEDQLSLCRDMRNSFHGSGGFGDDELFVAGKIYRHGELLTASYWRNSGTQGIMMINLLNPREILVSYWDVEINELALGRFDDDDLHNAKIYYRSKDETNLECDSFLQLNQLGWDGIWRDTTNGIGRFYTCQNGDSLQGIYSEVGWIEGQTNGIRAQGEYYSSGAIQNLARGEFDIQLSNYGHSFSGARSIDGKSYTWELERMDATSFYSSHCYSTIQGSVQGRWSYGKNPGDYISICFHGEQVEISYQYNGEIQGYGVGYSSSSGEESIQVTWFEENVSGIAMYRLTEGDTLTEIFWESFKSAFDVEYTICDDEELDLSYWARHSVNNLRRLSNDEDESSCSRNRYLRTESAFVITDSESSNSTSLIPHLYYVLFVFFTLCVYFM